MGNKLEPVVSYALHPNEYEVLAAFLMATGKYVRFKYYPLPECKKVATYNALAQADTTMVDRYEVKGYIDPKSGGVRKTKAGNNIVTLRNMNRRKKLPNGEGYYRDKRNKQPDGSSKIGFTQGEYLYRTSRLDVRDDQYGVDLSTLEICFGRKMGMVRMFPNAMSKTERLKDFEAMRV